MQAKNSAGLFNQIYLYESKMLPAYTCTIGKAKKATGKATYCSYCICSGSVTSSWVTSFLLQVQRFNAPLKRLQLEPLKNVTVETLMHSVWWDFLQFTGCYKAAIHVEYWKEEKAIAQARLKTPFWWIIQRSSGGHPEVIWPAPPMIGVCTSSASLPGERKAVYSGLIASPTPTTPEEYACLPWFQWYISSMIHENDKVGRAF